ncbi:MAG TPA: hypothetical protein VKT29_05630, partial [Terriglobales bacterium]|nr:hypothetical protein [Terriglobales bacterium]
NSPVAVLNVGDFSLSAPQSVSVSSPGGSASANLTIASIGSWAGTVNFTPASCSGLPAETTCSFSPASVTGPGATKLTITTTQSSMLQPLFGWPMAPFAVGCLFAVGGPMNQRRRKQFLSFIVLALVALTLSCGGGGTSSAVHNPGTPAGTYTVVVTGNSSLVNHTASFKLNVQ